MGAADDIQFTVRTFQRVLAVEKRRLAIGINLRRYIHEQLEKGVEPDHYRMDWMHHGIRHLIVELEKIGRAFNAAYPNDKFSTADMIDIAHSVVLTLKNYVEPDEDEVAGDD